MARLNCQPSTASRSSPQTGGSIANATTPLPIPRPALSFVSDETSPHA